MLTAEVTGFYPLTSKWGQYKDVVLEKSMVYLGGGVGTHNSPFIGRTFCTIIKLHQGYVHMCRTPSGSPEA